MGVAGLLLLGAVLPLVVPVARAIELGHSLEFPKVLPTGPAATHSTVWINTTDVPAFVPNSVNVTAGQLLTLVLHNGGTYSHTFTLAKNGSLVLAQNITPGALTAYFQLHPPALNSTLASSSTTWDNLTINSSWAGGHFEFVSLVPYQFQAGMFGFLNVQPPVRSSLAFYVNTTNALAFVSNLLNAAQVSVFPVQITVNLGNLGQLGHTFTLSPLPNYNLTVGNYTTFFQQHLPLINLLAPAGAGTFSNASFVVSTPGYYEFICSVPGHFTAGMFGFLYVGVPAPAAATGNLSAALVQQEVLIGGGALLGIGLILALVAAFTGRFSGSASAESKHS